MNLKSIAMTAVVLGTLSIGIGRYAQPGGAGNGALAAASLLSEGPQQKQVDEPNGSADLEKIAVELKMAEAMMAESQARYERAKSMYEHTLRRQAAVHTPEFAKSMKEIAWRFTYRLPVNLGEKQFVKGNRIDILEIWGTKPKFQSGGQYLVRARYTMPNCK